MSWIIPESLCKRDADFNKACELLLKIHHAEEPYDEILEFLLKHGYLKISYPILPSSDDLPEVPCTLRKKD